MREKVRHARNLAMRQIINVGESPRDGSAGYGDGDRNSGATDEVSCHMGFLTLLMSIVFSCFESFYDGTILPVFK